MVRELVPSPRSAFRRLGMAALGVGIVGTAAAVIGAVLDPRAFFQGYLHAYLFWIGMSLGCLALAMLHQLSGGMWGAALIRILEAGMSTLPLLALLYIPVALGILYLYSWTDVSLVGQDPILQHQAIYLNVPFFLIRAAVYLVVWIALAHYMRRLSVERDVTADPEFTPKLQRASALGLVVFGLTVSFAMIDWIMSLEPHWYSTIYAALLLMAAVLGAFAFAILVVALLDTRAPLNRVMAPGLFNDLGSLLLAFVMLWAYLGFSQFLIIYSGNLNQEIPWYLHRLQGGWEWFGLTVALLQFCVPFVLLLFRDLKRRPLTLAAVALLLVLARWIDNYWLVKPAFSPDHLTIGWLDVALPIAMGGLWIAYFLWQLGRRPLLPVHDRGLIQEAEAEFAKERASS